MEVSAPRAFANRLELGQGTSLCAEDFFVTRAASSVMSWRFFRGLARILPSNSKLDGEYKTPTSFAKGGSGILKSKNHYRLLISNTPQ